MDGQCQKALNEIALILLSLLAQFALLTLLAFFHALLLL